MRSQRSAQPKCEDKAGQLDVATKKVAKCLLPTEFEQPNGHMMNKVVKELERLGAWNADHISTDNRDDKANWQLDNVYRKRRVLQELCATKGGRFKDESGTWDQQAYDRAPKAETHDMITASGYRLIMTVHAQMDAGVAARRAERGAGEDALLPFSFTDFHRQQAKRDAQLWVTVRVLKLDPSTPFEHARNLLWHVENHREWHVARALLPADGGAPAATPADPHADAAVLAAAAAVAAAVVPAGDDGRTTLVFQAVDAMFVASMGDPISMKILLRAFEAHDDVLVVDIITALLQFQKAGFVTLDEAAGLITLIGIV